MCARWVLYVVWIVALTISPWSAFAQIPFGLGGDNPDSDTSRTPFRIKLSGFLNTKPEEGSVAVITLGISTYRETYHTSSRSSP